MPMQVKDWHNYPPNTDTPINRAALQGLEARVGNYVGAVASIGPGVAGYNDFKVKQHAAGDMTVDVGVANTLMGGYIALDTLGSVERYEYNGAQINVAIPAADATFPRIDRVVLVPGVTDSQAPSVAVIAGTPTSGTTNTTLVGAAVVPVGRTLLANVFVGAGATQILTAAIYDARGLPLPGSVSPSTQTEMVSLDAHPAVALTAQVSNSVTQVNLQSGYLAFLRRRITASTIRWKYMQGGTPLTGNYAIGIYDASGRLIVTTGAIAFGGGANVSRVETCPIPTTTFEAGQYYVVHGLASLSAGGSTALYTGYSIGTGLAAASPNPAVPGVGFAAGSGGTTMPTIMSIGTFYVDVWPQTALVSYMVVPAVVLAA